MPGEAQQQEDRAVGQRDVRELLGLLDEDRGEPGGQQQRRRDQRHQLAVAGAHELDLSAFELDHEVLRVVLRAQLVIRERLAPRGGDGLQRHARALVAAVELDAEREVDGQAPVDRHRVAAVGVGADEVDRLGREPEAAQDHREQDDGDHEPAGIRRRRLRLAPPVAAAPPGSGAVRGGTSPVSGSSAGSARARGSIADSATVPLARYSASCSSAARTACATPRAHRLLVAHARVGVRARGALARADRLALEGVVLAGLAVVLVLGVASAPGRRRRRRRRRRPRGGTGSR